MQFTICQNSGAQTTATLQKCFRARRDGAIHPIARSTLFHSMKIHALHFKVATDQLVKIDIARDHVATNQSGRAILKFEASAQFIEYLSRKKCDLALVIVFEIEIAIAANAAAGHAFDHRHFDRRINIRFAPVVAKEIMGRGNVKMADFHGCNGNIAPRCSRPVLWIKQIVAAGSLITAVMDCNFGEPRSATSATGLTERQSCIVTLGWPRSTISATRHTMRLRSFEKRN